MENWFPNPEISRNFVDYIQYMGGKKKKCPSEKNGRRIEKKKAENEKKKNAHFF